MAKSLENQETARKIVEAATELFAENNFEAVSLKKIASKAGANSALISYYFGNKQKLYEHILSDQADFFMSSLENLEATGLTPLKRMLHFLDEQTRSHLENPNAIRIIYRELLSPTEIGAETIEKKILTIQDRMIQALEEAIENGTVKPDTNTHAAAFTLISISAFYLLTHQYILASRRLSGEESDFSHIRKVYLTYFNSLLTGKESLA